MPFPSPFFSFLSWVASLRHLFFLNKGSYCYKLPSLKCLCCIPQVLSSCVSISIYLKIHSYLPVDFFPDWLAVQECAFYFPDICEFPVFLLLLISSFIPFCLGKTVDMISIFPNWSRHVPESNFWSILDSAPHMPEKNMYSAAPQCY